MGLADRNRVMHIVLFPNRWFPGDFETKLAWNTLYSSGLVLGGVATCDLWTRIFHCCLAQTLLGIPCPGCGITRASEALAHGGFAEALALNPAIFVLGLGFAAANIAAGLTLFTKPNGLMKLTRNINLLGALALLTVWLSRL